MKILQNIAIDNIVTLPNGKTISTLINKDGYVDLGELSKAYGATLHNITRSNVIKKIEKLYANKNLIIKKSGNTGYTLAHKSILFIFLRYFDIKYTMAVDNVLLAIVENVDNSNLIDISKLDDEMQKIFTSNIIPNNSIEHVESLILLVLENKGLDNILKYSDNYQYNNIIAKYNIIAKDNVTLR